jgi:hypothetical protein
MVTTAQVTIDASHIGCHDALSRSLIAVGLRRWRAPEAVRVRALLAAAASYASLFLLLLWGLLEPLELFVAERAESSGLQIHDVDETDEVDAGLIEAVPAGAKLPGK